MTPDEIRQARDAVGVGSRRLADLLRVNPRRVRAWISGEEEIRAHEAGALQALRTWAKQWMGKIEP